MSSQECTITPLGSCPATPVQLQADGKACIVGRSVGASMRLDHPSISRQHASFHFQSGRWTVTDLGSRHGTNLNGVPLVARQPMPLRGGDRISMLPWTIRFDVGSAVGATVVQTSDGDSGGTVVVMAPAVAPNEAQVRLDLLICSSVSIYSSASEGEMATEVAKACVSGTKCQRALVVRFLSGEGRLEVVGAWPMGAEGMRPISRTLVRGAAQGKPVRLSEDESFGAAQSIVGSGVNGALCIPIKIDSSIEAFLYLDEFPEKTEYDDVLSFSHALGRWVGLAMMRLQRAELESRQRDLLEELAVARQVQERMMGATWGCQGDVTWAMKSVPGQVVAGDIFGVYGSNSGLGATVFLGDVSGKGLGPGLLMAAITAHLEAKLSDGVGAEKALCDLSNFVESRATSGQFATFVMGEIDVPSRVCNLFDAGHGYYVIVDRLGIAKPIRVEAGIPIGVINGFLYEGTPITLDLGDRVVFFSDGLAEERDESGTMLGPERISDALAGSIGCEEDVFRLCELLKGFSKNLKYADDVTIASIMLASDVASDVASRRDGPSDSVSG